MYNATEPPPGPRNLVMMVGKQLRMEGFIVSHHFDLMPKFIEDVTPTLLYLLAVRVFDDRANAWGAVLLVALAVGIHILIALAKRHNGGPGAAKAALALRIFCVLAASLAIPLTVLLLLFHLPQGAD